MSDQFDPRDALGLIDAEGSRMRAALDVRLPWQLTAWGLAWLIGFGLMWLDVRDQDPYTGPGVGSGLPFVVLMLVAMTVTAFVIGRGTAGLGGRAQRVGRRVGLGWGLGWAGFYCVAGSLIRFGLPAEAIAVLFAGGAMFLTGLIYLVSAAVWDDAVQGWLGVWLIVVAAVGSFLGPVGVLIVGALAGGGGFLVAALVKPRQRA